MSTKKYKLTDETKVLQYGIMNSPTDAQYSAVEVADLIIRFNRDRLSGKIIF